MLVKFLLICAKQQAFIQKPMSTCAHPIRFI